MKEATCITSETQPDVSEWTESRHTVTFKFSGELQRPKTFESVIDLVRQAPFIQFTHAVISTHHYIARFKV